jgi:hypothetical protein
MTALIFPPASEIQRVVANFEDSFLEPVHDLAVAAITRS